MRKLWLTGFVIGVTFLALGRACLNGDANQTDVIINPRPLAMFDDSSPIQWKAVRDGTSPEDTDTDAHYNPDWTVPMGQRCVICGRGD